MNAQRMCSVAVAGLVLVLVAGCAPAPSSTFASVPATAATVPPAVSSSPVGPAALQLLVLGDSIAIPEMGCGGCLGFDRQYATYLESLTGRPVVLVNEARPEAQISSLQSVLDTEQAIQDAVAKADIVVVSIGYNNTPPWAPDMPCQTVPSERDADLWAAILAMTPACIDASVEIYAEQLDEAYGRIEELAAGRPQVRIALGSFDNLKDNPGGDGTIMDVDANVMAAAYLIFTSAMDAWNKADCAAASAHGFVCGDIYHAFNGPDGTGSIKALVNPADFVHPSEAGQAVIAELLQRVDVSSITRN